MARTTIKRDGLQITISTEVFLADTCAKSHELAEKRRARIGVSINEEPPNENGHLLYVYRDVDLDFAVSDDERQRTIDDAVDEMLRESRDEIACLREARQFEREASEWLDNAVEKSVNRHSD